MSYPRNWKLPNGERLVLNVGLAFEAFALQSQFTVYPGGKLDSFSLSYGDYGWKAGIWRLLDTLGELGISATMSTNGLAAERHPEAVAAAARQGIEINAHAWANDVRASDEDPDGELEELRRCVRVLTEASGSRPVGWVSPGMTGTGNTDRFLVQEGFLWSGDDASDDLPFIRRVGEGRLCVFPRAGLPTNDLRMWALAATSPEVIWHNFKATFDTLYAEGAAGRPKVLDITFHCHMAGRPTLNPIIRQLLNYVLQHEGVWIASRGEVARWALAYEGDEFSASEDRK